MGENFQGDAVVCERKDRHVNEAGAACRSCPRENPEAAPAPARFLEQKSIAMESESVRFSELFRQRPGFFDGKSLGILRAAKFVYRTNPTLRRGCRANERTEIHERGIIRRCSARGEKIDGAIPDCFAASGGIDRLAHIEQTRHDARDICFDQWNGSIERKCRNGVRRVTPDPRKRAKIVDLVRQHSAVLTENDFCESMQIARSGVVTQSLPAVENAGLRSKREGGKIGEAAKPLIVIRKDGGDLGLLKHELGNEDRVGVADPPPRQVAPVSAIPTQKGATEAANVLWRDQN